jgi:hypothetical protein
VIPDSMVYQELLVTRVMAVKTVATVHLDNLEIRVTSEMLEIEDTPVFKAAEDYLEKEVTREQEDTMDYLDMMDFKVIIYNNKIVNVFNFIFLLF